MRAEESIGHSNEGKSGRLLQRQSLRQRAILEALFVPPSSQPKSHSLSRHAIIAPITKGKQTPRNVNVVHDSLLPKNMRNVMIGNCPVKRVTEDPLFPKHNRHETEDCEKSCRECSCLNNRIRSRQTAASTVAREK